MAAIATGVALAIMVNVSDVRADEGYPPSQDLYVNDYAGLLSAEHTAGIRDLFVRLKSDTGVEAVVLTISSIHDYNTGDTTIESFATNLFNTWGIGDKDRNNGVLILVAVVDREVRIELGAGYGNAYNEAMQEVIDTHMLPAFRRSEYSEGIYEGALAMILRLTNSQSGLSPGKIAGIGAGALGALGAAALGFGRVRARYHRRRCTNCQTAMVRLDELSDDLYLDSGQKLEELLSSVDYDVWRCPACGMHTLYPFRSWFSRVKRCLQCGYRTVEVSSKVLVSPTYSSTGQEEVTKSCRNCGQRSTGLVILPMLTRSDSSSGSSSGSSFGGGSSSGGGATGKW